MAFGFSGMFEFKTVHGAPEKIFHSEVFQILKLGLYFEVFKIFSHEKQSLMTMLVE